MKITAISAICLVASAASPCFLSAQSPSDYNEGSRIIPIIGPGDWSFSWWGLLDRTYFIQHSENLVDWDYIPLIEPGNDEILSWGFSTTSDVMFLRLRHTDQPTSDPWLDDFDGDGLGNLDELERRLDPFERDTDGDGLDDGLELSKLNLNPLISSDIDNDNIPDDWERHFFGSIQARSKSSPYLADAGGPYSVNLAAESGIPALTGTVEAPPAFQAGLSFAWTQISGPTTAVISGASTLSPAITFQDSGLYRFRLVATNGTASSSDDAVITVDNSQSTPPTISFRSPVDGTIIDAGSMVLLWVDTNDADGSVVSVEYFRNGIPLEVTAQPFLANSDEPNPGPVTYTAVATDNDGNQATAFSSVVVIIPGTGDGDGDGGGGIDGDPNDPIPGAFRSLGPAPEGSLGGIPVLSVSSSGEGLIEDEEIFTAPRAGTYLVEVAITSAEYPQYTGSSSEYNDAVNWSFSTSWGGTRSGSHSVNSLHDTFDQADDNVAVVGVYEVRFPSDATGSDLEIHFEASSENIADGILSTTVTFRYLELIAEVEGQVPMSTNGSGGAQMSLNSLASQSSSQTPVASGDVVVIKPHGASDQLSPRMPVLKFRFSGLGSSDTIDWFLTSVSERADRSPIDDKRYPASGSVSQAGDVSIDASALIGNDFFGGDVTINATVTQGSNSFPAKFTFTIRGENPDDTKVEDLINTLNQQNYGGIHWYATSIAKTETWDSPHFYNQFNSPNQPAQFQGLPNKGPPDGWGIMQLDSSGFNRQISTDELYNWKLNVETGMDHLQSKVPIANTYFGSIQRAHGSGALSDLPTNYIPPGAVTGLTALEAATIQLYNTASVRILGTNALGNPETVISCWSFNPNAPVGSRWIFVPNANDYVRLVIWGAHDGNR